MAKPTTLKFGSFKVEIGDGATPEVFTAPCGFTQKSFTRSKTLNEVQVPDCDDPDDPVVIERDVQSLSWAVTGQGVLAGEAIAAWDAFYYSNDSRNVKITQVFGGAIGTIVYEGKAHLESIAFEGQTGNRATITVSLQSDGEQTRTPPLP